MIESTDVKFCNERQRLAAYAKQPGISIYEDIKIVCVNFKKIRKMYFNRLLIVHPDKASDFDKITSGMQRVLKEVF